MIRVVINLKNTGDEDEDYLVDALRRDLASGTGWLNHEALADLLRYYKGSIEVTKVAEDNLDAV